MHSAPISDMTVGGYAVYVERKRRDEKRAERNAAAGKAYYMCIYTHTYIYRREHDEKLAIDMIGTLLPSLHPTDLNFRLSPTTAS